MKKIAIYAAVLALSGGALYAAVAMEKTSDEAAQAQAAQETKEPLVCFESRKGSSEITQREIKPGWPNVKCSPTTGAALWYGDPFDGTVAMGKMPGLENLPEGHALVKPRSEKLAILPMCGTACHNGVGPTFSPPTLPKDRNPTPIPTMEGLVPDLKDLQHGRGRIFDQPQLLCGKCHGDKLRDWRDGIHGKRIGEFASDGKKRWFTCTECHNAHNVQDGERNRGFVQLHPEPPPQLPNGMKDAKHELVHAVPH
jgi:hypothetical protein